MPSIGRLPDQVSGGALHPSDKVWNQYICHVEVHPGDCGPLQNRHSTGDPCENRRRGAIPGRPHIAATLFCPTGPTAARRDYRGNLRSRGWNVGSRAKGKSGAGTDSRRFLLAQIYLGLLGDKLTLNDIRSAMDVFRRQGQRPGEDNKAQVLAHAYEQALKRIDGQMPGLKKLAMDVLSWITCAKRQLTMLELQHALATKPGRSELDDGDLPYIGDMVSVCAGLVTVDEESGIIRLVHYTTQEYLERTQKQWFPDAESAITTTCVTYLSFIVFETGFCTTDRQFEERLRLNPLYDYAARNWGHHARKNVKLIPAIIDFLENEAKVEASSQALMAAKRFSSHPNYSQEAPRKVKGLHLAGYFGVSKAADTLVGFGHSANLEDTHGRTPLWYAASSGYDTVVEKLIAAGADVNAAAGYGETALQAAAGGGHLEVVEKLLAAGADVNAAAAGYDGETALQAAAGGGHLEVIEKLLAAGADVNAAAGYMDGPRCKPQLEAAQLEAAI